MSEKELDSSNIEYTEETKPEGYVKQLEWDMAIGLQEVDNLKPSKYLEKLLEEELREYYIEKDKKQELNHNELECDFVSTRIVELLQIDNFELSVDYLKYIHKYLFQDVYEFAGEFRNIDFSKHEKILNNDSVAYGDCKTLKESLEYDISLEKERIKKMMKQFEIVLHYHFNEIEWLSKAMKSVLLPKKESDGKNHKEYTNEGLATVGDAIIKSVIADKLYKQGLTTKGSITDAKKNLENNETMHKVMLEEGWIKYSYNNDFFLMDKPPGNKNVVSGEHDPYIEAIVASIYYDSGSYDTTKRWILKWLVPLLEKYK